MYSILSHCSGNVLHRLFEVCELLGTSVQSTVCYDGSIGSFSLQAPVYRSIDILLLVQWFIPGVACVLAAQPGLVSNGLDGLHSDSALRIFKLCFTLWKAQPSGELHAYIVSRQDVF
jgi:hypothetical protein